MAAATAAAAAARESATEDPHGQHREREPERRPRVDELVEEAGSLLMGRFVGLSLASWGRHVNM